MAEVTLKLLHAYLKMLENGAELKRRMPTSSNPRTLKEGMYEMSRLLGVDESVFKDPQHIAALIGSQRFVMIWGEPSVTDHVTRVFDSSRVLLTVLIDPEHFSSSASGQRSMSGSAHQQNPATTTLSPGWAQPISDTPDVWPPFNVEPETACTTLKTMLAGNIPLTCRLFRALFEHMLGFPVQSGAPQSSASLVNELTGSKEHSRSFLSTALFILGAEMDREHLMSFMMQQGLFGIPIFEHLLQNRDYCGAFHSFRRLERAFMGSPAAEEAQLRNRLDKFNAQFGGKPYGAKLLEPDEHNKTKIDAFLAAIDLLEALALTPWCMSLNNAVSVASSNSVRSASIIAKYFERFGQDDIARERANQGIADHLLAFARQFSADTKPV